MKKRLLMLLTVLCLLSTTAFADVIVEPADSFWAGHEDDCDYLYRAYTVNHPDGYAALYESPLSSRQTETVPNGTEIYGNWHYTDRSGEVWCAVGSDVWDDEGRQEIRGWIKTSECLVVPDYISFQEAHGDEFVAYDHAYDHAFDDLETVVLWKYPGSGMVVADQIDAQWFRENTFPAETFDPCWRDAEGRLWGFTGYCYGVRNTWVCLDDPSNADLAADESVLPSSDTVYPAAAQVPPPSSGVTGLTVGGVLAVVAVSAGLLFLFARKPRRTSAIG